MRRGPNILPAGYALAFAVFGCASPAPTEVVPVAVEALALDATTVEIVFSSPLAEGAESGTFTVFEAARAEVKLPVRSVVSEGRALLLTTETQRPGVLYALAFPPLGFEGIASPDVPSQVTFVGFGLSSVHFRLNTAGLAVPGALFVLVTLDPSTGEYRDALQAVPLEDSEGNGVFLATVPARISRQALAARAVGPEDREAGALIAFSVTSTDPVEVEIPPRLPPLPEFEAPIDPMIGDNRALIRILFDDRPARALRQPALKSSLDSSGGFDITTSRVDTLRPLPGNPRVYEVLLEVEVDPGRRLDGSSAQTFPFVAYLVERSEDIAARGATFVVADETPQLFVIPVGNPAFVPVTFRVEAGRAFVDRDGLTRGKYPGESLFLTGEFPSAEDALGRLAADSFTGGERATLEMEERPDAPGIFEKTIFLPKNRPYGWKVVRCATGRGCSELNRHVASSGRAFATVMKNLVTSSQDAAGNPTVQVLDPAQLSSVRLEDGSFADYSAAVVSSDGSESPSNQVMFKQEAPDLVVTVGSVPVFTPIYVVGTWRDVNIDLTPAEIISSGQTLSLAPFDYDDGTQGRRPPIRERELPIDPGPPVRAPGEPMFSASDGAVDGTARQLFSAGRLPLWLAWNERELYVATEPAVAGRDHFVIVSLDPPTRILPAHWGKNGTAAAGTRTIFLAMEGDGAFFGWFARGTTGRDDRLLEGLGISSAGGVVLEGSIDLQRAGFGVPGQTIWISAVSYGTLDGDSISPGAQNPAGNGDFLLDPNELLELDLATIRAL